MQIKKKGKLYVIATPIGNLQDITLRALEILKQVDRIAAEDTRYAALLLKHFSIHKPTISLHEFNEHKRVSVLLNGLRTGQSMALISDAGTPLISDPGFQLVSSAKAENITVIPIPGPCAAIAALSAAGLPTDRFVFEGFLPPKAGPRKKRLKQMLHETRTIIFYESPRRLLASLEDMVEVFGKIRRAVIARELTKIHESILQDDLHYLLNHFKTHTNELRGEIVILIKGNDQEGESPGFSSDTLLHTLLKELPLKQAVSLTSKITGERKNVLYEQALKVASKT